MFDGPGFPLALDEDVFDQWIEKGKTDKLGFRYLLIVWDEYDSAYRPQYAQKREEFDHYPRYESSTSRESLIAVYDLYSESRVV